MQVLWKSSLCAHLWLWDSSFGFFLNSVEAYLFQTPRLLWLPLWIRTLDFSLFLKYLNTKYVFQGSVPQQHGNPTYCHCHSHICSENSVGQNSVDNSISSLHSWNFLFISCYLSPFAIFLLPANHKIPCHVVLWTAHHKNCDVSKLTLFTLEQTSNQDKLPQIDTVRRLFICCMFLKYLLYIYVVVAMCQEGWFLEKE